MTINTKENDPKTFLNQLVLEQYNSKQGQEFYRKVMGDDGHNIHYGLYNNINDSIHEAAQKIIYHMSQLAQEKGINLKGAKVLDLGSGNGGAAHYLSKTFDCFVTCVNLCPEQNQVNLQRAEELGVSDKINVVECDFETLPESWQESFDLVWSEEAFCHAKNRQNLFTQIARILKEGGVLVFSDIMCGEGELSKESKLSSFSDRNAILDLAKPSDYLKYSQASCLKNITYQDFSHHLSINFTKMIQQIDANYGEMLEKGVSADYLHQFRKSLSDRLVATDSGCFCWGCLAMNKGYKEIAYPLHAMILGKSIIELTPQKMTELSLAHLGKLVKSDSEYSEVQNDQSNLGSNSILGTNEEKSGLSTDVMSICWEGGIVSASNMALNCVYQNVAFGDRHNSIYIEWFNYHSKSPQKFSATGKKLLYVLAPAGEHLEPHDFVALISDGQQDVIINPGVWHTVPIPLDNEAEVLSPTQLADDITVNNYLASEKNSWLKIILA